MGKKARIGFFGLGRGSYYLRIVKDFENVEIAGVCDMDDIALKRIKPDCPDTAKYYTDFDEFINNCKMDGIVLCNYFYDHAYYAVKAMEKGIAVLSETTAAGTLKECVDLVRCYEKTGSKYMLAENYPFMCPCLELKRIAEGGTLGKPYYYEGEYVHPIPDNILQTISPGEDHWRRHIPPTYYLTHSVAPIAMISGSMPVKVNAKAVRNYPYNPDGSEKAIKIDPVAIMLCEMDNGALARFTGWATMGIHGNWYRMACEKGGAETVRGDQEYIRLGYVEGMAPEGAKLNRIYKSEWQSNANLAEKAGRGGGEFWVMHEFTEYILNDKEPFFDVYKSVILSALAVLAWRSCLANGAEFTVPDFKNETDRKKYEKDDSTPFPNALGTKDLSERLK